MRGSGPLKRLNTELSRGGPLGMDELASVGVSPALTNHYVKTGWLLRLGRGTFAFPADELVPYRCVAFLQAKWPDMHLAGASALRLRGVTTLWDPMPRFDFWGAAAIRLPEWFTERFEARYLQRGRVDVVGAEQAGVSLVRADGALVMASEPERAVLEVLAMSAPGAAARRALAEAISKGMALNIGALQAAIDSWPSAGVRTAAGALIRAMQVIK